MGIRDDPTHGEDPSAIRNQIELRTAEMGKSAIIKNRMIGKSARETQRLPRQMMGDQNRGPTSGRLWETL